MNAKYGWIIDKDLIADTSEPAETNLNATGLTGPRDISPEITARLKAGEGRKFRMKDDDGELYYEGRIVSEEEGTEDDFGPLDDFGRPNAGCTSIEYYTDKGWECL